MITKPKGTYDLYGSASKRWQYVSDLIDAVCEKYNYTLMRTPVFEETKLFHRSVGETTDMVSKETYDFKDRGDRDMTLRPEGTAGIIRAYIENKLYGDAIQPQKFYYNETMYRYERPQAGRYRELTQFGVEVLGSDDPYTDAEVISIPVNIYRMLGLKNIKVNINSLGDKESRENYRTALLEYLKPHIGELCEDCQRRYETNPLRVLDCKVDAESEILKNAPKTIDYLNEASKERFDKVLEYLDVLDIEYEVNPRIVRGLDYYNHTVFEIEATVEGFGSQNVLGAGGRYNGLVEMLDGPSTPGVGFAMGLERLMLALEKEEIHIPVKDNVDVYLMYVSEDEKQFAIDLTQNLRLNGYITEMENMGRSLKTQFKVADRLGAKYLVILNSDDIKNGMIQIKDNVTKEENKIKYNDLIEYLDTNM